MSWVDQDGQTRPKVSAWRSRLHEAVWRGDHQLLKELVTKSFHVEQKDSNPLEEEDHQMTALYVAALKNDIEAARILLEAGVDVNNGGSLATPPIFSAAAKGNLEMVILNVLKQKRK